MLWKKSRPTWGQTYVSYKKNIIKSFRYSLTLEIYFFIGENIGHEYSRSVYLQIFIVTRSQNNLALFYLIFTLFTK